MSKLALGIAPPLALLALLSPRSQAARKHLNTILYFTSMGLCSIYGILLALVVWVVPGERLNIFYFVARAMHTLTSFLTGTRCTVEGYENIPQSSPCVMIGNHQSSLDILYLGAMFPKHTSIMAKKELKWVPFLGQWMSLSGAVWIDRKSRKDAIATFARIGQRMHRDNLSLWIFPEGTRSKLPVPGLLPFKMGAFHLALQAGVPVVPVVCENYYPLYDNGRTRFEAGTIRIRILPPVSSEGYSRETVHDFADKVHGVMLNELHRLDGDRDAADTQGLTVPQGGNSPEAMGQAAEAAEHSLPARTARDQLGGVSRWMSYLVGVGSGPNVVKQVEKQKKELHSQGLGYGSDPKDFGLVSYADQQAEDKEKDASASASASVSAAPDSSANAAESSQVQPTTGEAAARKVAAPSGDPKSELNESGVLVDKAEAVPGS